MERHSFITTDDDYLCLLPSPFNRSDIDFPALDKLSGSAQHSFSQIPQLTAQAIENMLDGHFRDYKTGKGTTNLLRKGVNLVIGHHVLGC